MSGWRVGPTVLPRDRPPSGINNQSAALDDSAAEAFVAAMFDHHLEAERRTGVVGRRSMIAGRRLELRSAGPSMLEALAGPLEHLPTADGEPNQLTVSLFDTTSSGVEPPPWPLALPEIVPGTRPLFRFQDDARYVTIDPVRGWTQVIDCDRSAAVFHLVTWGVVSSMLRRSGSRGPALSWSARVGPANRRSRSAARSRA